MSQLQVSIIPVTPFQQNCTLIWNNETRVGVVIDPGGENQRIEKAIQDAGFSPNKILLTHGHIDHAAGAMELKEKLAIPIVGPHIDDLPLLSGLEEQAAMFSIDGVVRNVVPDQWLEEGNVVEIGGVDFQVFHCPGHAPGHVVFHNADLKFAHVGDVLFAGSIGRTDLPGGNHAALINAIKTKLMKWDDDVRFICGHGPASSIGAERRTNPFLQ